MASSAITSCLISATICGCVLFANEMVLLTARRNEGFVSSPSPAQKFAFAELELRVIARIANSSLLPEAFAYLNEQ